MKLRFVHLLLFFHCAHLIFNFALTNSTNLFTNQLFADKNPHSVVDYKNALSLFANEAETFLRNEIMDLEHSLRVHGQIMNRPKRSINVDTSSRTYPENIQNKKIGMHRFNLTFVKELFHIEGVTIEDLALIKPIDTGPSYIIVAGQPSIGHFKPIVKLPILSLGGGFAVTSLELVSIPGAIGVEAFVIDGVCYFIFAVNTGRDFVDPIIHSSKLYKINEQDGSVRSIQTFLTVSSSKWKRFVVNGRTYLAQASYMKYAESLRNSSQCDGTKLIAAKSVKIYEWIGKAFKRVSTIKGNYVTDVDECSIRGRHFLVLANRQMNSVASNKSFVYVYEITGASKNAAIKFRLFQKLPASAPRNVRCFRSSDTLFLTIADEYGMESGKRFYNKESLVYRFNGLFFIRYKKILAFGGLQWDHLTVSGSDPSVLLLRLRTLTSEHLSFAVSDGRWIRLEMRSLYGVQHLLALNDDYVIASTRNNGLVLMKWNVRIDADFQNACSDLNIQLKKILLQRISVEGELKQLIDKLRTDKELVTNEKRNYLTVIGQKLQRLEVEVMDVDRLLHSMTVKSERSGGYNDLIVDELSVGLLTARSLDAVTINGVAFRPFVDDAVKIIPYSENRLSFGSVRFSRFVVKDSVVLKGPLNDAVFPRDFAVVGAVNTFSAPQKTEVATFSDLLNIVEGTLDGVELSNVMTTSGDQVVRSKVVLETDLRVKSLAVVIGTVDGVDWKWLTSEAVRLDRSGTVKGDVEFAGNVEVLHRLDVEGRLNGVDVIALKKHAVTLAGPQTINSGAIAWSDVVFTKDLLSPIVNGKRFPEDFRLLGNARAWRFDSLTLSSSSKMMSLNVHGKINGLNLNEDVVTTHDRQVIMGRKTFAHARMNNVTLLANDRRTPLRLSELKAAEVRVLGRQYPDVSELLEHSARKINEDLDFDTMAFKAGVVFKNNVEMPSSVFDGLMRLRSDRPLVLHQPSFNRVEYRSDVVVSGLVNGLNLRHFARNTLLTTGDQRVSGRLRFNDRFTASKVRAFKNVLGSDFSWSRERSNLNLRTELNLLRLSVGRLRVADRFCGADITEFLTNTVRSNVSQRIIGKKTFRSSLIVDSVETKFVASVGGKDFTYLATNSIYSDEDFLMNGGVHFTGPLRVSYLDVGFVNGVDMNRFYGNTLLVDESREIVIEGSLEAKRVDVDRLNGLNVTRYFSEVVLTTSSMLSKYVTFDRIVVKKRLTFSGTINGIRIEDFIYRGAKNVVFDAPKNFLGPVYVSNGLDVIGGLLTASSVESVDQLIVDGALDVTRSIDGIHWNGFLRDAVIIKSGQSVTLNGNLDFERLNLDAIVEMDGLFSGFHLKRLNSSMLKVDTDQIVDGDLVFRDVTFHAAVRGANVEVTNELEIEGRNLDWWTRLSLRNRKLSIIFTGPVTVLENLDVTGMVDGVRLEDVVTSNGPKQVSEMMISTLKVDNLRVTGLLMGVNVSEWSRKSIDINASNIRIGGSKTLNDFVPLGKVVCSHRARVDSEGTESILPKCQAGDIPLILNSDIMMENGFNFSVSPSSCSSINQLISTLNGLSLQLDSYELNRSFKNRLLCKFVTGTRVQPAYVSVTLSCFPWKRYAVVVERGGLETVAFMLPETVDGTVEVCHAFYDKHGLVIVMGNSRELSSQVLVWSSASNRLVTMDGTLQDVTNFTTTYYSKVWLATTSISSASRTHLKQVNIWIWSSVTQTFKRLQNIEQPYVNVVARFVQSIATMVISSFDAGQSSLITAMSYFEDSDEFVSRFSTIESVDSSTMAVCHHEKMTIMAFLNRNGTLVVIEYEGSSSPVSHFFRVSSDSKLFCLYNSKCPMILVRDTISVKAYCYRAENLLEMGTIFTKDVTQVASAETNEHSYITIQTKPADRNIDCHLGDSFIYRRLNYDSLLAACVPECRKETGESSNAEKVILSETPSIGSSCKEPWCTLDGSRPRPPLPLPLVTAATQLQSAITDMIPTVDYGFGETLSAIIIANDEDSAVSTESIDERDGIEFFDVSTEKSVDDNEDSVEPSTETSADDERTDLVDITTESYVDIDETIVEGSTRGVVEPRVESMVPFSTEAIMETDEDAEIVILPTETISEISTKNILKVATEYVIDGVKASSETVVETSDKSILEASTKYFVPDFNEAISEVSTESIVKITVDDAIVASTDYFTEDRRVEEVSTETITETVAEDVVEMSTEDIGKRQEEILDASTETIVERPSEDVVAVSTEYFVDHQRELIVAVSTKVGDEIPFEEGTFHLSTEYFIKDRRDAVVEVSTEFIAEAALEQIVDVSTEYIAEGRKDEILDASTVTIVETTVEESVEVFTEPFIKDQRESLVASTDTIVEAVSGDLRDVSTEYASEGRRKDIVVASTETFVDTTAENLVEVSTEYISDIKEEVGFAASTETLLKSTVDDIPEVSTEVIGEDHEVALVVTTQFFVETTAEDLAELSTESVGEEQKDKILEASTEFVVETHVEDIIEMSTRYISEEQKEEVPVASTETFVETTSEVLAEVATEYARKDQKEEITVVSTESFEGAAAEDVVEMSTEYISEDQKEEIPQASTETFEETAAELLVKVSTEYLSEDQREEVIEASTETFEGSSVEDVFVLSTEYIVQDRKEEIVQASTETFVKTVVDDLVEPSTEYIREDRMDDILLVSTETFEETTTEGLVEMSTELVVKDHVEDILAASTETIVEESAEDIVEVSTESMSKDGVEAIFVASTEVFEETAAEDLVEVSTEAISEKVVEELLAASTETFEETPAEDLVEVSTEVMSKDGVEKSLVASTAAFEGTVAEDLLEVSTEYISDDRKEQYLEVSTESMVDTVAEDLVEVSTEYIGEYQEESLPEAFTETFKETPLKDIVELSTEYLIEGRKQHFQVASTESIVETSVDDKGEGILAVSTETIEETSVEDVIELSTEYVIKDQGDDVFEMSTETILEAHAEVAGDVSTEAIIYAPVVAINMLSTTEYFVEGRSEVAKASTEDGVETLGYDILEVTSEEAKLLTELEPILYLSTEAFAEDVEESPATFYPFECSPHGIYTSTRKVKESLLESVSSTPAKPLKQPTTIRSVTSPASRTPKMPVLTTKLEHVATEAAVLAPFEEGCVQGIPRETVVETTVEDIVEVSTEYFIVGRKDKVVDVSTEALEGTYVEDVDVSTEDIANYEKEQFLKSSTEFFVETPREDTVVASTEFFIDDQKHIVDVSTETFMETSAKYLFDISTEANVDVEKEGFVESSTEVVAETAVDYVVVSTEGAVDDGIEEIGGMSTETIVETTVVNVGGSSSEYLAEDRKEVIPDVSTDNIVETHTEDVLGLSTDHIGVDREGESLEASTETMFETLWENILALSTEYFVGHGRDTVEVSTESVDKTVPDDIVEVSTMYFSKDETEAAVELSTENIEETSTQIVVESPLDDIVEVSTDYFFEDPKEKVLDVSTEIIVRAPTEDFVTVSTEHLGEILKEEILEASTETLLETRVEDIDAASTEYFLEDLKEKVLDVSTEIVIGAPTEDIVAVSTKHLGDILKEEILEASTETLLETLVEDIDAASTEYFVEDLKEKVLDVSTEIIIGAPTGDIVAVSTEHLGEVQKEEILEATTETIVETSLDDIVVEVSTEYFVKDQKELFIALSTGASYETTDEDIVEASTEAFVETTDEQIVEVSTETIAETTKKDIVEASTETVVEITEKDIAEASTETVVETIDKDSVEVSTEHVVETIDEGIAEVFIETVVETTDEDIVEVYTEAFVETTDDQIVEASTETIAETTKKDTVEGSTETVLKTTKKDIVEASSEIFVETTEKDIVEGSTESVVETTDEDIVEASTEAFVEITDEDIVEASTEYIVGTSMKDLVEMSSRYFDEDVRKILLDSSTEVIVETPVDDIVEVSTIYFAEELKEYVVDASTESIVEVLPEDIGDVSTEHIVEHKKYDILETSTEIIAETPEDVVVDSSTEFDVSGTKENGEAYTENLVETTVEDIVDVSTEHIFVDKKGILETSTEVIVESYPDVIELSTEYFFEGESKFAEANMEIVLETTVRDVAEVSTEDMYKDKDDFLEASTESAVQIPVEDIVEVSTERRVSFRKEEVVVEMSTKPFLEDEEKILAFSTEIADTDVDASKFSTFNFVEDKAETILDEKPTASIYVSSSFPLEVKAQVTDSYKSTSTQKMKESIVSSTVKSLKHFSVPSQTARIEQVATEAAILPPSDEECVEGIERETVIETTVEDVVEISTEYFVEDRKDVLEVSSEITAETVTDDIVEVSTEYIGEGKKVELGDTSTEGSLDMLVEDVVLSTKYFTDDRRDAVEVSTENIMETIQEDIMEVSTEDIGEVKQEIMDTSTEGIIETPSEDFVEVSTADTDEEQKDFHRMSTETLVETPSEDFEVSTRVISESFAENVVEVSTENLVEDRKEVIAGISTETIDESKTDSADISTEHVVDDRGAEMKVSTDSFVEAVTEFVSASKEKDLTEPSTAVFIELSTEDEAGMSPETVNFVEVSTEVLTKDKLDDVVLSTETFLVDKYDLSSVSTEIFEPDEEHVMKFTTMNIIEDEVETVFDVSTESPTEDKLEIMIASTASFTEVAPVEVAQSSTVIIIKDVNEEILATSMTVSEKHNEDFYKVTSKVPFEVTKPRGMNSTTSIKPLHSSKHSTTISTIATSDAKEPKLLAENVTFEHVATEAVFSASSEVHGEGTRHSSTPAIVVAISSAKSVAREPPCDDAFKLESATVYPVAEVPPPLNVRDEDSKDCDDTNTDSAGFTVTDFAIFKDEDVVGTEFTSVMTTFEDDVNEVTEAMEEFSTIMSTTEEDGSLVYGGGAGGCDI